MLRLQIESRFVLLCCIPTPSHGLIESPQIDQRLHGAGIKSDRHGECPRTLVEPYSLKEDQPKVVVRRGVTLVRAHRLRKGLLRSLELTLRSKRQTSLVGNRGGLRVERISPYKKRLYTLRLSAAKPRQSEEDHSKSHEAQAHAPFPNRAHPTHGTISTPTTKADSRMNKTISKDYLRAANSRPAVSSHPNYTTLCVEGKPRMHTPPVSFLRNGRVDHAG